MIKTYLQCEPRHKFIQYHRLSGDIKQHEPDHDRGHNGYALDIHMQRMRTAELQTKSRQSADGRY